MGKQNLIKIEQKTLENDISDSFHALQFSNTYMVF